MYPLPRRKWQGRRSPHLPLWLRNRSFRLQPCGSASPAPFQRPSRWVARRFSRAPQAPIAANLTTLSCPGPPAACSTLHRAPARESVCFPQDKPEDEQIAYFRRLYASYQQQFSRERAKRDRAVFACIDQYRSVSPGRC